MLSSLQSRYADALDSALHTLLADLPADAPQLAIMARYALGLTDAQGQPTAGAAGKRIRPTLLLLCTEAAAGDWRQALPAAAAVELLHNFSLVHDDIQDDSRLRRGRPALWCVWGRPHAINAGDLLFSLAFAALRGLAASDVSPATRFAVHDALTHSCLELTRGQHLDLRFERYESLSVPQYLSMIAGKSAALIAACAGIGARIAGADEARVAHFTCFARNLGLAFQIRDDILGIWGDPTRTGKSAATDIRSRKKTLPVLYALERSPQLAERYRHEPRADDDLREILSLLEAHGAREHAQAATLRYARAAQDALALAAPADAPGRRLSAFTAALLQRDY